MKTNNVISAIINQLGFNKRAAGFVPSPSLMSAHHGEAGTTSTRTTLAEGKVAQ